MQKPKLAVLISVFCCILILSCIVLAISPTPISPSNLIQYVGGQLVDVYGNPISLNGTSLNATQVNMTSLFFQGQNRTDALANPVGPCSYIIDSVGSTYRMINQTTGQVDYQNSNASKVINYAIGNLTGGGAITVKAGTYTFDSQILVSNNNVGLTFVNCNLTLASSTVTSSDFSFFYASNKNHLYFNFENSMIDFNIANQSPSATVQVAGIKIHSCTDIVIPYFKGTGFGSTKCFGDAIWFNQSSNIYIGYSEADNLGADNVAFEGCQNVTIGQIKTDKFGLYDDGGGSLAIYNNIVGQESYNFQVSSVWGTSGGICANIVALNGPTHNVQIGEVYGVNMNYGALSISSVSGLVPSDYNVSNINVDNVYAQNIYGGGGGAWGIVIEGSDHTQACNVTVGNAQLSDCGTYGIRIQYATQINVANFNVYGAGSSGVGIFYSNYTTVRGRVRDVAWNGSAYDGVGLTDSLYCTVTLDSMILDSATYHPNHAIEEWASAPGLADYNLLNLGFADATSGSPIQKVGAHTLSTLPDCPVDSHGTFVLASSTSEQTLLTWVSGTNLTGILKVYNVWLDLNALTQNCTIQVYNKIDGTNYRLMPSFTLSNINATITGPGLVMKELMFDTDFKITITSTIAEGATRNIYYRIFSEEY